MTSGTGRAVKRPALTPDIMPNIRDSVLLVEDAKNALDRYCWNKIQLKDAINSAKYFINLAEQELDKP